ncbi:sulfatase [Candidatus Poribacteria bacterium]|nr:sulfatase [Candidatus Poribacteria bacterium]
MYDSEKIKLSQTRRTFLGRTVRGIGSLALASLLNPSSLTAKVKLGQQEWKGILQPTHFAPRAKRVIHLCMAGGPSHLETLDYKPKLAVMDGKPMPESFTTGQPIAQLQGNSELKCLGPTHPFQKYGKSGQEISTAFPKIGQIADEICIIRSMQTEQINHDPAHTFMNTGTAISGRPSMGSWLLYGLGSESDNLPGYVVLTSSGGGQDQPIAARQWHSGFLPGQFQGVQFHSSGDPIHYVGRPNGVSINQQQDVVNTVNNLNGILNETVDDPEISTRISQYEMAFRMQTSVPDLMDVSDEPQHIRDLYGAQPGDGSFASNCLLARRLAERGVRFIQLYHRGWDHHGGIKNAIGVTAGLVDQASAALVTDLKQRGMLDDTLIIWGGEFGRTPMAQGSGRDHHIRGFSVWMAGGGIKGGVSYGNTDELGYYAVEDIVHVHDFHATILHLLGIDHQKLTYRFQGRDFRLTDVHGHPVNNIIA